MEIAIVGLACLLVGLYFGVRKGRRDVIKALRVPDGYVISSVGFKKIRGER